MKLFDYFEVCRLGFGSSCSLNNLLKANGEEVKSSSGAQAVQWAAEKTGRLLHAGHHLDAPHLSALIRVHTFDGMGQARLVQEAHVRAKEEEKPLAAA